MGTFKIYTKTGDTGETSLVGGRRVSKSHPKVCAYGKADELISLVALLRCKLSPSLQGAELQGAELQGAELQNAELQEIDGHLRRVEIALMQLSARIASLDSSKVCGVCAADVAFLEQEIDSMQAELPPLDKFVLPGKPEASALCHVVRTVCREVERLMVEAEKESVSMEDFEHLDRVQFEYINRLSDYFFVLSRYICVKSGVVEDFWLP